MNNSYKQQCVKLLHLPHQMERISYTPKRIRVGTCTGLRSPRRFLVALRMLLPASWSSVWTCRSNILHRTTGSRLLLFGFDTDLISPTWGTGHRYPHRFLKESISGKNVFKGEMFNSLI